MNHILEQYNISPDLSLDEQLVLLEKEKQKLLRKLNHVFGDPEREEELTYGKKISLVTDVAIYYLRKREFEAYGHWCQYGAQLGFGYFMELMYDYHTEESFGAKDPQKAFYLLQIYDKAEICLKAAYDIGAAESEATYFMGRMYNSKNNKTGERQIETAKIWYERSYQKKPFGSLCYDLGMIYLELDETESAIFLLLQGARDFDNEDCLNVLNVLKEKNLQF